MTVIVTANYYEQCPNVHRDLLLSNLQPYAAPQVLLILTQNTLLPPASHAMFNLGKHSSYASVSTSTDSCVYHRLRPASGLWVRGLDSRSLSYSPSDFYRLVGQNVYYD